MSITFGLSDRTITQLQRYFASQPEVARVLVYGSRALGTYTPGSDIDLAIISTGREDISARVKTELESLSTPYLFDVTDYNHINHSPLKEHIDRVGKLLYQADSATTGTNSSS